MPALLLSPAAFAQRPIDPRPAAVSPQESVAEGRRLVDALLTQKPEANSTNAGVVRVRFADDRELHIPVKFKIYSTPENWISVYQSLPADGVPGEELTVVHAGKQPNEYSLMRLTGPNPAPTPTRLSGDAVMVPFASSDFWIADLGLDFLHWPLQRVLRREMRHGQPCAVLESTNPHPSAAGYTRVVSWVDTDNGGILHADAYDAAGQLVKEFDPTGLKKVDGQRKLEEMEMRNRKTGSHTWIKFDLAPQG